MPNPYFELSGATIAKRLDVPEEPAEVVVGRSTECQLVIASSAVSRRHAVLRRQEDQVVIEDLGSSNGTFVNGERLSGPRALKDRDRVSFGSVDALFVLPPPPPPPLAPAAEATIVAPAPPPETKAEPTPPRTSPPAEPARIEPTPTATRQIKTEPAAPAQAAPVAAARPGAPLGQPTTLELAAIALGSFLVVFAIGAVLLRYVF